MYFSSTCLFYHNGVLVGKSFPPFAVGIIGIGDHHKGIVVELTYGGGDGLDLAHGHHHEESAVRLEGVEALAAEDGGSTVDILQDVLAQRLIAFLGNDEDNLIVLRARHHICSSTTRNTITLLNIRKQGGRSN